MGSCGAFCSFCGRCGKTVEKSFEDVKHLTALPPGVSAQNLQQGGESAKDVSRSSSDKCEDIKFVAGVFDYDSTRKISQAKAENNLDGLSEENSCKISLQ